MQKLIVEDWGRIEYSLALQQQKVLIEKIRSGEQKSTLVFCEHDPVITLGRGSLRTESFVSPGLPVVQVERGGLATYHGPGQLVGYPILKLSPQHESPCPGGIKSLVCLMENTLIELLKDYQVDAHRIEGKTGVWIDEKRKVASIGVAVSHWVSFHGFALNINTNKEHWKLINPCGFSSAVMTNLCDETSQEVSMGKVKKQFQDIFFRRINKQENCC